MDKIKVGIIFGGVSTEHEVSRCSASSIIKEIDYNLFDIEVFEISKDNNLYVYKDLNDKDLFAKLIKNEINSLKKSEIEFNKEYFEACNVIFPIIHGTGGEDGCLQGFFECIEKPYVGADVLSSAVSFDKCISKLLFEKANIPQADYLFFNVDDDNNEIVKSIENKFVYPIFVKPATQGSSVGVSKVYDSTQLFKALNICKKVSRKILIEEYIKGREIECAVLGDYNNLAVSDVGEILLESDFYSYDAKYISEEETVILKDLDNKTKEKIQNYAKEAFKSVDCYGLARVDFFLCEDNKIVLNEINTLPGFTKISMYPKLMIGTGISYKELITKLIDLAIKRKEKYKYVTDYNEVLKNEQ